jgi:hypothetical protein
MANGFLCFNATCRRVLSGPWVNGAFKNFAERSTRHYLILQVEEDPNGISKPSIATHEIKFHELMLNVSE